MRKKTRKTLAKVALAASILLGASYLAQTYYDRQIEIEGYKVNLVEVDSYHFKKVNEKVTFYQEEHKQMIWAFVYDGNLVSSELSFLEINKDSMFVVVTLKEAYRLPLQLVGTNLAGTFSKTIDLTITNVDSISLNETEVQL